MTLDNTQLNVEDNPTGENKLDNNQGTQTVQPQADKKDEGKTYSKEEFDTNMANTRRATERDTKKKLLAELGLTLEDEDKLVKYKQAYEASLTDEEKRNTELQSLQTEKARLSHDLEEKDYIIKALVQLTGKSEKDVDKIVKMAKGLKTDENTIDEAIEEVISMINVEKPSTTVTAPTINQSMPISEELQQPSTMVTVSTNDNPWKEGNINLTKQGQLLRSNPELARKLAEEAGVKLK